MSNLGDISAACAAVASAEHPASENGGPCATCAFRKGTEANTTEHTVLLVQLCVEGGRYFHCHEQPQLCRGYIAAANMRGVPEGPQAVGMRVIADALGEALAKAKQLEGHG